VLEVAHAREDDAHRRRRRVSRGKRHLCDERRPQHHPHLSTAAVAIATASINVVRVVASTAPLALLRTGRGLGTVLAALFRVPTKDNKPGPQPITQRGQTNLELKLTATTTHGAAGQYPVMLLELFASPCEPLCRPYPSPIGPKPLRSSGSRAKRCSDLRHDETTHTRARACLWVRGECEKSFKCGGGI